MTLTELSLINLQIPFNVSFKHSSAERTITQAVVVTARSTSGAIGLGEGCPREYVTGETIESAKAFFTAQRKFLLSKIDSLESLTDFVRDHEALIDTHPAAWCAIELALLDLIAKEKKQSLETLLGLPPLAGSFQYTAVVGDSSWDKFIVQANRYFAMDFDDFKLKISGTPADDRRRIMFLQEKGPRKARVRVDANNLWRNRDVAIDYFKGLEAPLFGIEEPLTAMQFRDLKEVGEATRTTIILDESFRNRSHFPAIQESAASFIINIRISKMGGLLRALEVARVARDLKLPIILGAQVGETSLLTRAALTLAQAFRDILLAQEGAFGLRLLHHDIVKCPLEFQQRGLLAPKTFLNRSEFGMQLSYQLDRIPLSCRKTIA